jgi:hypothetical protein
MIYDLGSLDPPHSPLPPPESTVAKGQAMEDGKICVGLGSCPLFVELGERPLLFSSLAVFQLY